MNDGKLLLTIVAGIAILLVLAPYLFGALKESGHLRSPKFGRRSSYPTFPNDGEEF